MSGIQGSSHCAPTSVSGEDLKRCFKLLHTAAPWDQTPAHSCFASKGNLVFRLKHLRRWVQGEHGCCWNLMWINKQRIFKKFKELEIMRWNQRGWGTDGINPMNTCLFELFNVGITTIGKKQKFIKWRYWKAGNNETEQWRKFSLELFQQTPDQKIWRVHWILNRASKREYSPFSHVLGKWTPTIHIKLNQPPERESK